MSSSRLCKVICTVKLRNFSLCGEREGGGAEKGRERERAVGREKGRERETNKQTETERKRGKQ